MKVKLELTANWELSHDLEVEVDEEIFSAWCKDARVREDDPLSVDEFIHQYYSIVNVEHPPVPCETIKLVCNTWGKPKEDDDTRTVVNNILGCKELVTAHEAKVIKPIQFEPARDIEWFEVKPKQKDRDES